MNKKTCNTEQLIPFATGLHTAILGHTISNLLTSKAWLEQLWDTVYFQMLYDVTGEESSQNTNINTYFIKFQVF